MFGDPAALFSVMCARCCPPPSCGTAHMHRPVTQNFCCASSTQISLPCPSFPSCSSGSACAVWSCRAVGLGFWLETMSRILFLFQRSSVFPRSQACSKAGGSATTPIFCLKQLRTTWPRFSWLLWGVFSLTFSHRG